MMSCMAALCNNPDLIRADPRTQPTSSRTTPGIPTRRLRTRRWLRVVTASDGRERQHSISLSDIPAELSEQRTCIIEQPTSIELLTPVRYAVRRGRSGRHVMDSAANVGSDFIRSMSEGPWSLRLYRWLHRRGVLRRCKRTDTELPVNALISACLSASSIMFPIDEDVFAPGIDQPTRCWAPALRARLDTR